jgi:hypothetical protein
MSWFKRRKKEQVCDFCKAVYTCSRKEHRRSPECNLGQMRLFFESIRKDPLEENSLNFNIDLRQFSNNMNSNKDNHMITIMATT